MTKYDQLAIIEGVLFLAGDEGKTVKEIAYVLDISISETNDLLKDLEELYQRDETRGIMLVCLGEHYKLATKKEYHVYFEKMVKRNEASLSNAALETLAIIAYNQPITRSEIEKIRGVSSDAMVRRLQAKALIKEAGREETPGRPILYEVSEEFMDAFNLKSLDELPDLDIKEEVNEDDLFQAKYTEEEN